MLHIMESLESVGVTRRRITREEYLRMAEVGILRDDERVELLRGEVVVMSPSGRPHSQSVTRLNRMPGDRASRGWR